MKTTYALPLLLICLGLTPGCGQVKDRADKTVVATDASAVKSAQNSQQFSLDVNQIKQFIDLYGGGTGFTKEALLNIFEKYKDQLGKFLAGTKFTPSELLDLLFKLDTNNDGRLSVGEVAKGLENRMPILRWISDNAASIGEDELDAALAQEYPNASIPARGTLKVTLMRYGETWAGGNGNNRLTRQELSSAGLILGMLNDTDFSQPISLPSGSPDGQKLAVEQLHNKINQQLFGRYAPITDNSKLTTPDAQLEWSALALQFHLMDRLIDIYGTDGTIAMNKMPDALKAWGVAEQPHWQSLYKLYDQVFVGGAGNGKFATLQMFNLLTDVRFAERLWIHLDENVTAATLQASKERPYILRTLLTLFPRTGQALFMGDLADWKKDHWAIRKEYWDGLKAFDSKKLGGDANGTLDIGEFTTALAYARLIENLYATYDTNHDGFLSKQEAADLFRTLGVNDGRMIDAFFADVGLDGGKDDVSFFEKIKIFFSGGLKIHPLTPYEFHVRLIKILPRMLLGEIKPGPHDGRSGE